MAKKKGFFREPLVTDIRKYISVKEIDENLIDEILNLGSDEAVVIKTRLIPGDYENSRKFMKHGRDVKIARFMSLKDALEKKLTPVQLRDDAFNKIRNIAYCCYTIKPFIGTDIRTRRVSLEDAIDGTKIYSGSHQEGMGGPISVKKYGDAKRVEKDGAEFIVEVPSRTEGVSAYEIKFSSVPTVDNMYKWGIAYNIFTNHSCKHKTYDIRYRYMWDKESSRVFNFCAHEIAAYLAIIDYSLNVDKNMIPLQMSQFAIPTKETVDFYIKLVNNCLIKTEDDKRHRKLNRAEKEILLWGLVHKLGHDRTFYARESIDGLVKDYNWGVTS